MDFIKRARDDLIAAAREVAYIDDDQSGDMDSHFHADRLPETHAGRTDQRQRLHE